MQESIYLNSIYGMVESITDGKNKSIEDCISEDEIIW